VVSVLRMGVGALFAALVLGGGLAPAGRAQITAPPPIPAAPPAAPAAITAANPLRGVWFTLNDMGTLRDQARLEAAVDQLAQLGFTTLYPVVWNGGYAYYPSAVTQQRGIQDFTFRGLQGQDPLAELIRLAQARGMQVMPWFEFGFMAPPSSELALKNPRWLSQKRDGSTLSESAAGEVVRLNPFHPEVQQLLTELVLEVVGAYPVEGIQLDDHFSLPNAFGYDSFTRALYLRETGRAVPSNPEDGAWVRWRADKLTAYLRRLRAAVRAKRPGVLISLSPNYADFAYKLQLQDWRTWVKEGLVDEVVVQIYRPDEQTFTAKLRRPEFQPVPEGTGAKLARKVPMAVAIMAGTRQRPTPLPLLAAQAQVARQRGLGLAFFHYGPLWEFTADPAGRRRELEGVLGP
jgi:uncharacterized lipoprotein YddW (UPF0748 family)